MIQGSRVHAVPALDAEKAREALLQKLSLETDPSDLHHDLKSGVPGLVVVDGRKAESYALGHIPGSRHLHYAAVTAEATKAWSKQDLHVCYCSGVGCNASTKLAFNLAALGFKVKELIGGIAEWEGEGYPVALGMEPGQL